MLTYDGKNDSGSLAELAAAMQKIVGLNPRFAPAFVVQSRIYVLQNKLDLALRAAAQARNLEPDRAGYWTNIAAIFFRSRDYPNAIRIGESVVARWDGPDAAEALGVVERARRASGVQATPQELEREAEAMKYAKDTTSAEGFVESVSCKDEKATEVVLRSGDRAVKFRIGKGFGYGRSDTLWIGSEQFRVCHHAKGMKAIVRYKPVSDSGVLGELSWPELLDELIPPEQNSVAAN
jgi:tetratricopeptide (TPR) repeat protein